MADEPTDALAKYNAKRDFTKTAEPAGTYEKLSWGSGDGFMVQKHDATRLHWDLRLELDGTLKSWAVPKGPSLDPKDNRLSVRTEDHPLSYATFEGTIPKGEYGGGTVMMWDRGTWASLPGKDPRKGLEEGHLHFTLQGERMKGEWVMFRLKPRPGERNENWMLKKVTDDYAGSSAGLTDHYLTSIKTGRTMQEIAAGKRAKELKGWVAGLSGRAETQIVSPPARDPAMKRGKAKSMAIPVFREPQKATLADHVPAGSGWLYEMKYDGYRCLIAIGGGKAKVYTRSGLDWSAKFPEIAEAAAGLEVGSALLDGEIVSLDAEGRTNFSALQAAISAGGRGLACFLFDALEVDGEDLTRLPNLERKNRLASLVGEGRAPLLYAEHIVGSGEQLLQAMCDAGQEGVIAKKAEAPYRSARTKCWLKIKCTRRQEFVVIGWIDSSSATRGLRSLILAVTEGDKLRFAGKVGTGFSMDVEQKLLARLKRLERKAAPADVPRAEARGARWVRPELVAEVAFAEFTAEGVVRHASFLGLRGDKKPDEVVLETEVPLASSEVEKPIAQGPGKRLSTSLETSGETGAAPTIKISNPERVIFPDANITKGELFAYHEAVGALMLEWAANRPLSLVRCPQGRAKKCFFQKHNTGSFGPSVHQIEIREGKGTVEDYVYVQDVAGLLACVQMGTIEFHGWGSTTQDVEKPDRLIFDLDPDEGLGFAEVRRAAQDLRTILADMGLQSFAMLTGGKGLHVVVPLRPQAEWPAVKDFAQRFAIALATAEPERFTANLAKVKRKGRIFIDYLRNQRGATAIMPYSARAREGAPVAAPINWDELEEMEGGNRFTVRDAALLLERASARALQGWGEANQSLPEL